VIIIVPDAIASSFNSELKIHTNAKKHGAPKTLGVGACEAPSRGDRINRIIQDSGFEIGAREIHPVDPVNPV
jgi:hypothetical protein